MGLSSQGEGIEPIHEGIVHRVRLGTLDGTEQTGRDWVLKVD
jgi:hypothetical protein